MRISDSCRARRSSTKRAGAGRVGWLVVELAVGVEQRRDGRCVFGAGEADGHGLRRHDWAASGAAPGIGPSLPSP
jgi:hypothetical protein